MLSNAASLRPFAFELVLALGIFVVLGVGLLAKTASRRLSLGLTTVTLLGAVLAMHATAEPEARGLFGGLVARDAYGDFFKLLAAVAGAIVALASIASEEVLDQRDGDRDAAEYGALLLAVVLGAGLMAAASDLLTVTLSVELVSILSYALAAFSRRTSRSAEAGLKYVIYGGVATGTMLYGFSLLYGLAGSTDLVAVRTVVATAPVIVSATALALCLAGFGFKLAIVPFHAWCPDVYEGAPTPISAFFSIVPKAAGFALVYRFLIGADAPTDAGGAPAPWAVALGALAVASMTLGNLAALAQRNLKRLLAYSSIAHAGTMLLAFAAGTEAASRALLLYLGIYLFMNLAAFLAAMALFRQGVGETVDDFAGLGRRAPVPALCLTLALISLTGLPPLGGFVAKYAIISAVIARGVDGGGATFFLLALAAVLNTVVSLAYYARVVKAMYFGHPAKHHGGPLHLAPLHTALLVVTTVPVVLLGVYLQPLSSLVARSTQLWSGR
ncbi:MAG TPA: NADH-quinone oxidoreductase subunit N [Polyangia bacterium]|jgi:NADH-quinone oxidoreductase subunit N